MASYFKTQWFRFLIACICAIVAIGYMFQPAVDTTTIEGLNIYCGDMFTSICWWISSVVWFVTAETEHHAACLKKLNERIEVLEKTKEQ